MSIENDLLWFFCNEGRQAHNAFIEVGLLIFAMMSGHCEEVHCQRTVFFFITMAGIRSNASFGSVALNLANLQFLAAMWLVHLHL